MAKKGHYYKLKKELGFWQTTLYGVGIILGAGIYALLGIGAGVSGNMIWLSFVIAAIMAFFTGLSYAELSSMYPKDAAEYVYTKKAFGRNNLSFIVQWIMLFTVIVSGSTVALGFGGYFAHMFGGSVPVIAAGLILVLSLINYIGMKESSEFNVVSTIIETSGLIIIAVIGVFFIGRNSIDYFSLPPMGVAGVLSGTALIFFAYLGFEEMVNLSEETKNARKNVPKALVMALMISTILYIMVSLSAVTIVGTEKLAASKAPLSDVVATALPGVPNASFIFSLIALFATSNTVLVILIVGSRMLYGLARNNSIPKAFGTVGRRNTPYISIVVVMALSILILMLSGIKTIALLTDVGIFIVYIFVNSSLIWLRYKQPDAKRGFRSPLNIGRFPVLAFLGVLTSAGILFYFEAQLLLYELVVVIAGFVFYKAFRHYKSAKSPDAPVVRPSK